MITSAAYGANPNLVPLDARPQQPGESDEAYALSQENAPGLPSYPLDIATSRLECSDYPPMREYFQRIIEKLRQAGTRSRWEE